jgi:hypothetical protein
VKASLPFIENAELRKLFTEENPESALVTRPSRSTGNNYEFISKAYYTAVHEVLSGKKDARSAVEKLREEIKRILRRP